jgi:hypothetical protein
MESLRPLVPPKASPAVMPFLIVEQDKNHDEDNRTDDKVDVVFREHAWNARDKEVLLQDQFDTLSEENKTEGELDTPDNRLGEELGDLVHCAGGREQEEERSEDDSRSADNRLRDHSRISDSDRTDGLQGLHRDRQAVKETGEEIEQSE